MPEREVASRYDAFISYSHRDRTWVEGHLVPRLKRARIRVCIDTQDFEPGAPTIREIESVLAQTLDPAARARRVLPVVLRRCEPPLRIQALTHVDFTGGDEGRAYDRLAAAIRDGSQCVSDG